jgi:hypothetical protein
MTFCALKYSEFFWITFWPLIPRKSKFLLYALKTLLLGSNKKICLYSSWITTPVRKRKDTRVPRLQGSSTDIYHALMKNLSLPTMQILRPSHTWTSSDSSLHTEEQRRPPKAEDLSHLCPTHCSQESSLLVSIENINSKGACTQKPRGETQMVIFPLSSIGHFLSHLSPFPTTQFVK